MTGTSTRQKKVEISQKICGLLRIYELYILGYVIAYVEPNGLVDKDGRFKVGDELINVNGHSLRGLSMEAARNVLRQLSGHVDIIVARQPQETNQSANAGESRL